MLIIIVLGFVCLFFIFLLIISMADWLTDLMTDRFIDWIINVAQNLFFVFVFCLFFYYFDFKLKKIIELEGWWELRFIS